MILSSPSPILVLAIAKIILGLILLGFIWIDCSAYFMASLNLPCASLTSAKPMNVLASISSLEVKNVFW